MSTTMQRILRNSPHHTWLNTTTVHTESLFTPIAVHSKTAKIITPNHWSCHGGAVTFSRGLVVQGIYANMALRVEWTDEACQMISARHWAWRKACVIMKQNKWIICDALPCLYILYHKHGKPIIPILFASWQTWMIMIAMVWIWVT